MAPRETENNAYAKFLGDKQTALWYVMVFSGVVNSNVLRSTSPANSRRISGRRFSRPEMRLLFSGYVLPTPSSDLSCS